MSEKKPIKLKDIVHSLASTMVVTSQFLDQSTVDLQNLYAHSGSGALAAMTPPRFTLDEVTIDLSFIVADVAISENTEPVEAATKEVKLTPPQRKSLIDKLDKLAESEREEWQNWDAEQNRLAAEQREYQASLRDFESTKGRMEGELRNIEDGIEQVSRQIAGRTHNVSVLNAELEAATDPGTHEALSTRLATETQNLGHLNGLLKDLEAEKARHEPELEALHEQRPEPPEQPSPDSTAQPPTPQDYTALWTAFEEDYQRLKTTYIKASEAFQRRRPLPKIKQFITPSEELKAAVKQAGATVRTLEKLDKICADQEETLANLGQLAARVAERKGDGIKVRVDPEAIAEAPETARQKIALTFRSESQENVQLEGEQLDIAR